MDLLRLWRAGVLALACALMIGTPAFAQSITQADIQRLQDTIYDVSRDVSAVRSRDAQLASDLQAELDDLRDETVYLKVKLRKHETIARSEFTDLRERIDAIGSRAHDQSARSTPPFDRSTSEQDPLPRATGTRGTSGRTREIPSGTEFDVRLQGSLTSDTAQVEDRFEATTMVDLSEGDRVLVPAGSVMRGVVSSVQKAGRVERKGSMTVAFDRITVNGRDYPIRATVTQALESEGIKGEVGKIGAGAGIGAIIGGILGGGKGALAGILIGGGGTIAATEGKDVELPAGTVLRVRLDSGLALR